MEKDLLTHDDKDSDSSLGSWISTEKKQSASTPKRQLEYKIIAIKNVKPFEQKPQKGLSQKSEQEITKADQEDDKIQNLVDLSVHSSQFWESRSQASSISSILSRLTVTNEKIEFKINIIGNKKYLIHQNRKQDRNQVNFNKVKLKISQQTSQASKDLQQEVNEMPIEKLFTQKNSWDQLDEINKSDPQNQITYMVYRQILNSDKIEINQSQHSQVKAYIISESLKQKNSYFTILLALQAYLKSIDPSINVIFCQKSSLKTQVSMKILSTGFAFQKFKISQKIKRKNQFLTFEQIMENKKNYLCFEDWYNLYFQTQYLKELKKKPIEIKFTSISKLLTGDLCVQWDTYQPEIITNNPQTLKRVKVSPYFQKFYLSIEDFDTTRGNIKFPQIQKSFYRRGNYPYFPPQNCSRYSIKVWNKFDSGNNQWLSMNNNKNQWPSAYFGLYNPKLRNFDKNSNNPNMSVSTFAEEFQPIMQLKNNLKNTLSLNTNQKVGQGIICTPYMWNALRDTQQVQVNGQKYVLVFQCRLDRKKLKITEKEEYWMVNKFCDVRPYGIILVPKKVKMHYPNPQNRFSSTFNYIKLKEYLDSKFSSVQKVESTP